MFYCFVNPQNITETEISITGENFFHLRNVRRVKVGEKIKVRSDRYIYKAVVKSVSKNRITAEITEKTAAENKRPYKIFLAPALIQEKNFDLILQFGTQLGADGFFPIITKNVSNKNIKPNRKQRWEKIITSAAMQSQRLEIPFIEQACSFDEIFQNQALTPVIKILPYELESEHRFSSFSLEKENQYLIFIGPEGGWAADEIVAALNRNVRIVSLGDYILRAETAALVSLTVLNSLLGNL